jgi:hypothetical protein
MKHPGKFWVAMGLLMGICTQKTEAVRYFPVKMIPVFNRKSG